MSYCPKSMEALAGSDEPSLSDIRRINEVLFPQTIASDWRIKFDKASESRKRRYLTAKKNGTKMRHSFDRPIGLHTSVPDLSDCVICGPKGFTKCYCQYFIKMGFVPICLDSPIFNQSTDDYSDIPIPVSPVAVT